MYIPKHFRNEDAAEIRQLIRTYGFAILVNQTASGLHATHLPLELVTGADGSEYLQGHISRANPQWKGFSDNDEVLAIFSGPHTYISSSWYNHENVPTWNYLAVHVTGKVKLLEGEALYQSLKHLVNRYEAGNPNAVTLEGMSPDYVEKQMKGLVGLEIAITGIDAVQKLSQNRDAVNHERIVSALENREDPDSHLIAAAMKKQGRQP